MLSSYRTGRGTVHHPVGLCLAGSVAQCYNLVARLALGSSHGRQTAPVSAVVLRVNSHDRGCAGQ